MIPTVRAEIFPLELTELRRRLRCMLQEHDKTWSPGVLGPVWTCRRCGASGDLEDHAKMTFMDHVITVGPTILIVLLAWWIFRRFFGT